VSTRCNDATNRIENNNKGLGNYITVKCGKQNIDALVDSGAVVSIISLGLARSLNLQIKPITKQTYIPLVSANGSQMNIIGITEFYFLLEGIIIHQTVRVCANLRQPFIIGSDLLYERGAVIDLNQGLFSIQDDLVTVPLHTKNDLLNCVTTTKKIAIPPFAEMLIPVKSPAWFNGCSALLEPLPKVQFSYFAAAKALVRCENNRTVCRIWNCKPYVTTIRKGVKVAKLENFSNISAVLEPLKISPGCHTLNAVNTSVVDLDEFHKNYKFKLNPELTEIQRYQILQLLYDYKDVFARDLSEIQQCNAKPLEIQMHTPQKVFRRQFKLNQDDAREVEKQLAEMYKYGIIEDADTPYYDSPIFCVRKRDSSKCLVIDLRGINALIVPRLIQLPNIDELLNNIAQQKPNWYSVLDIKSAYWQLGLHPNSRPYTAFTAPSGRRYQFCRSPFGLSTSPFHLLSSLLPLFGDKTKYHGISLYMDDVLISSNTFQDHLNQLKLTLSTLRDYRFSCNPIKTELAFQSVEYLGFILDGKGIQMSDKRIQAIQKITPPKNVKALQRILGLLNFWRKFIPQYAQHSFYMRQLLRKDAKFLWTQECQDELDYMKMKLCKPPILRALQPNAPIYLQVDGSSHGFGYVIMQRDQNGNFYVIQYGAKSTNPAQQKYNSDNLEILSLVYALQAIEHTAMGRPIYTVFHKKTTPLIFVRN